MKALLDMRFMKPTLYGLGFAFGLFLSMQTLIATGRYLAEKGEKLQVIDFVRLKKESDLETRERRKPPKPEPPKTPPPPKMVVETPPQDTPPTPFQMPKLDVPNSLSGGPFLGAYVGGGAGTGDLVPMVRITPQYPREAARDGVQGSVLFELVVNPDGTVKQARIIKAEPRGYFERAATGVIYKWKFKPKMEDGKPVESKATYLMEFKLLDDE